MSAKFCGSCGSPLSENAAFCQNCGWKVVVPTTAPQGAPVYQQPPAYQQPVQPTYPQQPPGYQPQGQGYVPSQPIKKKSGCGGCLIVLIIVLLLAASLVFFGGKLVKTQLDKMGIDTSELNLPKIDMPGVEIPDFGGGKYKAEDISGPYTNTFETLNVTVDGKTDPNYYTMIGQKQTLGGRIEMQDSEKGTMTFSGSSYGVDVNYAMPVTVKGDAFEVHFEDEATHTTLIYKGTLSMDDERLKIEGTYETSYADPYSSSVVVMTGNWTANSSKGTVSKELDTSKAIKDVTIDQLQGTWSGSFVYAKIENLDQMPDVTEEDKEMARSIIGKTMNARMLFEGDNLMITIEDPTGGESDLEDLPPINLDKGVFTTSLVMNESDGTGNMNLSGVVFQGDAGLQINAEMTMEMAFVNNNTLKMVLTFDVTKDQ